MKPETQQKILRVLCRMFADLDAWLKSLGVSEAQIVPIYLSAIREDGIGAQLISAKAVTAFPLAANISVNPNTIVRELREARSGEYAAWLLTLPEPDPAELAIFLGCVADALPNLGKNLMGAAKAAPRYKHGPQPRKLTDPAIRENIRAKITSLRRPGTTLDEIYSRLENEYPGVKSATFKRIWQEGLKKEATEIKEKPEN